MAYIEQSNPPSSSIVRIIYCHFSSITLEKSSFAACVCILAILARAKTFFTHAFTFSLRKRSAKYLLAFSRYFDSRPLEHVSGLFNKYRQPGRIVVRCCHPLYSASNLPAAMELSANHTQLASGSSRFNLLINTVIARVCMGYTWSIHTRNTCT